MPRKPKHLMTEEEQEALRAYYREYHKKRKENMTLDKLKEFKEKTKERNKRYKETNKDILKEKKKEYDSNNKDKIKSSWKAYYEINKDKLNQKSIDYGKENRHLINQRKKERRLTDPNYRLIENVRNLIKSALKKKNFKKESRTQDILGCNPAEFQKHIESQWEPWMNWDNYGLYNGEPNYGWDIDHKIPNNSANTYEEVIKLNHHTNLQPLCSYINRDVKRYNPDY
jgi:hypothetical protein